MRFSTCRMGITHSKYSIVAAVTTLLVFFLLYFGFFSHFQEKNYFSEFSYPLEIDVLPLVKEWKEGRHPSVAPINFFNYSYLKLPENKCPVETKPRLLFIIKSALPNIDRRNAIRQTWGYESRFSLTIIRRVFLVGINPSDPIMQRSIDDEYNRNQDLVQANYIDSYGNNTLKTMSGFKWAVQFCSQAQFIVFADDDMYISTKNMLRYIRDTSDNIGNPEPRDMPLSVNKQMKKIPYMTEEDEEYQDYIHLYAGYVFHSSPQRHKTSKWYVSLDEYPFHLWPPYATAGAYVVSRRVLLDLYYASLYTQYFRFDDVFLGLVARKANIELTHCSEFYFWKKNYSLREYRYVIASHGYQDPNELMETWKEQKRAGYA